MNKTKVMLVIAFFVMLSCIFLSRAWYSGGNRPLHVVGFRENPAQLMPHNLKDIASCIEILRTESLDDSIQKQCVKAVRPDICNVMASVATANATRNGRICSDGDLIAILANRRLIKILDELNALPAFERRAKALSCYDSVMTHFEKVVVDAFSSMQMQSRERHAVNFALYCLAENGTAIDLIDAFERLERSEVALLRQLGESKKRKNLDLFSISESFPDLRLRMNILLTGLDKLGKSNDFPDLLEGLRKELLPVPQWDAPLMTLEARRRPFSEGESRPSFINPNGKWKEYAIYDWPSEFYLQSAGRQEKQRERVHTALAALRASVSGATK